MEVNSLCRMDIQGYKTVFGVDLDRYVSGSGLSFSKCISLKVARDTISLWAVSAK